MLNHTQDIVTDVEKYPLQAAKIGQDVDIIFTLLNFFFTACSVDFKRLLNFFKPYCHASVNRNWLLFLLPRFSFFADFFGILQPMLNGLRQRWKVGNSQLLLILCTFAVTGTLTAYISRAITSWVGLDETDFWGWKILLRLTVLIFGYQVIILIVSMLFGQFRFFWNYEKKILAWLGLMKPVDSWQLAVSGEEVGGNPPSFGGSRGEVGRGEVGRGEVHLAIFASGAGSNAQKIIDHFRDNPGVKVALIVCNRPGAGVLAIAKRENIPTLLIEKERFFRGDGFLPELQRLHIDAIILAGFLWKVPSILIKAFPQKIINIHPALLPNYGGKGMYGHFVHEAVIAAKESKSGITIHLVDEVYDHGAVIFQAEVPITENDTPESLAKKVQVLEHQHFPRVVAEWVQLQNRR